MYVCPVVSSSPHPICAETDMVQTFAWSSMGSGCEASTGGRGLGVNRGGLFGGMMRKETWKTPVYYTNGPDCLVQTIFACRFKFTCSLPRTEPLIDHVTLYSYRLCKYYIVIVQIVHSQLQLVSLFVCGIVSLFKWKIHATSSTSHVRCQRLTGPSWGEEMKNKVGLFVCFFVCVIVRLFKWKIRATSSTSRRLTGSLAGGNEK